MKKKLGCGPLVAIVLIAFIFLVVGGNEAAGIYFSHCNSQDDFDCLWEELEKPEGEEEEEGTVTAVGSYTYKDYTVAVTMHIPLGGGAVTGSVADTCEGRVNGNYNSQTGVISGSMAGACSPFFVNVPANAPFNGSVNKTTKTVQYDFQGSGGGFKHEGTMTLKYQ